MAGINDLSEEQVLNYAGVLEGLVRRCYFKGNEQLAKGDVLFSERAKKPYEEARKFFSLAIYYAETIMRIVHQKFKDYPNSNGEAFLNRADDNFTKAYRQLSCVNALLDKYK